MENPRDIRNLLESFDRAADVHAEAVDDRVEPLSYRIETDSGDDYEIEIQNEGGKERAFVVANGITVATFTVGGAGSIDARIQKPDEVMNMLAEAMQQASRR